MRKAEVSVGKVYAAKISNQLAPVRLDGESPYGGWSATNLATKRQVRIKSAAKLRFELEKRDGKWRRKEVAS